MPSSRGVKAEVADDVQDPDESELRTYDNITLMSRNFTFKGRVMFKIIGEKWQKGTLKNSSNFILSVYLLIMLYLLQQLLHDQ